MSGCCVSEYQVLDVVQLRTPLCLTMCGAFVCLKQTLPVQYKIMSVYIAYSVHTYTMNNES